MVKHLRWFSVPDFLCRSHWHLGLGKHIWHLSAQNSAFQNKKKTNIPSYCVGKFKRKTVMDNTDIIHLQGSCCWSVPVNYNYFAKYWNFGLSGFPLHLFPFTTARRWVYVLKADSELEHILFSCQKVNYKEPLKLMEDLCSIYLAYSSLVKMCI